ncbi:MAG TPA: DUF4097 family beta strand repeat-containing protein [Gemmatimonadaceae bacterium]|nr:DUF4097 family beta strand repeat-containing protein [Gemmatimonadaceae bacterium]
MHLGGGGVKIFSAAGAVRIVGWDRDSLLVRGHIARGERFTFTRAGNSIAGAVVLGVIDFAGVAVARPSTFTVYVPRTAKVSVKTARANIDAHDASGWFFSVAGSVRLSGTATSAEVESISGDLDVDLNTAWVRARTGGGRVLLRGSPQDADVSTVSGAMDIDAPALARGQFASVSGNIHYDGAPAAGAIFDFSNHSGAVDLLLAHDASAVFPLTSVNGPIENGRTAVRPIRTEPHSLRLEVGPGAAGAHVAVRTFRGAIRLRAQ